MSTNTTKYKAMWPMRIVESPLVLVHELHVESFKYPDYQGITYTNLHSINYILYDVHSMTPYCIAGPAVRYRGYRVHYFRHATTNEDRSISSDFLSMTTLLSCADSLHNSAFYDTPEEAIRALQKLTAERPRYTVTVRQGT